ncbi:V-type ATP synthase subunit F [bacterium]
MLFLIGEPEIWNALKPIGVTVVECAASDETLTALEDTIEKEFKLIFLSEKLALEIEPKLDKYRKVFGTSLILIPSPIDNVRDKKQSLSEKNLKAVIEKAIGVDILQQ